MKKQSAFRSAFFTPRGLLAISLCSIGVLLAMAGFSTPVTDSFGNPISKTGAIRHQATEQKLDANPVPFLNQPLLPDAIAPGGAEFTLTLNGTGFVSDASVNWNGDARATTFVSASQLTATILASDIANASTASVTVVNPAPGGGTSNTVFLPVTQPTSSLSFTTSEYATGNAPRYVAIGDFNGDGKQDVAVANNLGSTVSVFLGNGDGTFQTRADYVTGLNPSSVAVGDFNFDGKLDLVLANFSNSNSVSVLLGNGDGTFQAEIEYGAGVNPDDAVVGDFDQDGKLDIAAANYNGNNVSILLGNGDGTFQPQVSYKAGVNPTGALVGDFNQDGTLDLAVPNNNPPQGFTILLGNGDGSFQMGSASHWGTNPRVGMAADFNLDGTLDLSIANYADDQGLNNNFSISIGNGDGSFKTQVKYTAGKNPQGVRGGDLNGDGKLDLVTANSTSNDISVLLGQGDGTFQTHVDYPGGTGPNQLAIGDFNNDGRLDVVTANYFGNTISVFLQSGGPGNLNLLSAASVKGGFGIDLPLTGPSGVEDRSGRPNGKFTVVMTFDQNIVSVGSASSTCGGIQSVVIESSDPHKVDFNLSGVAHACNGSTITITANSISDDQGNVLGSASVGMGLLLGDVNGDRVVDSADISEAQSHKGQKDDETNFRSDVSANGYIEVTDIRLIRQQFGTSLP